MTETQARTHDARYHVAFGVDHAFVRPMGVAIASILNRNPGLPFTFHVFAPSISPADRWRLDALAGHGKCEVEIHPVDLGTISGLFRIPAPSVWTAAILTRLLMPELVHLRVQRLLYLDADTLCVGSIQDLLETDLQGAAIAAVPDAPESAQRRIAPLGLRSGRYFNSGILLIDVQRWMSLDATSKCLDVLARHADLVFPDQDALNVVFDGLVHFLPRRWNYMLPPHTPLTGDQLDQTVAAEASIVHFTASPKPWHSWYPHAHMQRRYVEALGASPWMDVPLDLPRDYKQMKKLAKLMLARQHPLQAARWYIPYAWFSATGKLSRRFRHLRKRAPEPPRIAA